MRSAWVNGEARCRLAFAAAACLAVSTLALFPVLIPWILRIEAVLRQILGANVYLAILLGFLLALAFSVSGRTNRAGPPSQAEVSVASGSPCRIAAEIRQGLTRGEFIPYYQPIVSLATGALSGFESLARWEHPERGLVGPAGFIRHAEDSGIIHELSIVLLARACADMRDWPAHLSLSINLSPVQLAQEWMAPTILKTLHAHGIAPGRLIVELTESRCISDFERARQVLDALKSAGVQVALDDFGIGYSSFMRLRELSFDRIKIDRAFTGQLARVENSEIVRALLNLGDGLGVPVVAEGIETRGMAARLAQLGCAYGQGFLYSPPISAKAAADLIRRSAAVPSPPYHPLRRKTRRKSRFPRNTVRDIRRA